MKKIITMIAIATLSFALTPREIAEKSNNRDDGDKIVANMSMVLIDKRGKQRVREYKRYSIDQKDDIYSMMFFNKPTNIKDTSFLSLDYFGDRDDDQWLYLPALKKVKRIASDDKSSSFMGSDFTYSDMTKKNTDDYEYKLLKESKVRGNNVWVIQAIPKAQKTIDETGYTKSIIFIRKDNFVMTRAIHFVKQGKKLKYMDVEKLETIDGIDTATKLTMTTKKGKKTLHKTAIIINDIKYNQDINKSIFNTRNIEKGL
jgi:hypothetical protein